MLRRHLVTASTYSIRYLPRERHSLLAALARHGFITSLAFDS